MVRLTIDGEKVEIAADSTILDAAQSVDIYIPSLCFHPDLPPAPGLKPTGGVYRGSDFIENVVQANQVVEYDGCELCVVQVEGHEGFQRACDTVVDEGMVVHTNTPELQEHRREKLSQILVTHPHACLTCAQLEGCSREPCPPNVPVDERCCEKLGRCELQNIAEYVGIRGDTPRYIPQKLPIVDKEPLFVRDYNLCIGCTRCVRACRALRGVDALGLAFDGEILLVGTTAPLLIDSGCKFCGACVEICPTGALMDSEVVWADREKALLPCVYDCPLGIDVPRYIRLVGEGNYSEASAVIREKAPLPSVLAHICHHPCEERCRRREINEAICILGLKRVAIEHDTEQWKQKVSVLPSTTKRVAVIGSGPAGLTAAYYLNKLGHSITVFESYPKPGGMLRYGIPRYRLPREVLNADIQLLTDLGVKIQTGTTVGKSSTIADLQEQGYDAILVAIGAQLSKKIEIEGDNLQGVLWGLDFLKNVTMDCHSEIGENVVVVGGGNVAIDVSRTALRLGAKRVMLTCLENKEEMPAHNWEIQEAVEEGVELYPSWGPKRILGKNGNVCGVELICCTCVFDEDGRFNPRFDDNKTKQFEADTVILAIGQSVDLSQIGEGVEFEKSEIGAIATGKGTLQTSHPGVFAAGDAVDGPSSVVEAMAAGQQVASSIDKYLGGTGLIEEEFAEQPVYAERLGRDESFTSWKRAPLPLLQIDKRRKSFDEVELSFNKRSATDEGRRCLQCDLRIRISPVILPPKEWIVFDADQITHVPAQPGVFLLADEDKTVLAIKGTANLRDALEHHLTVQPKARFFKFEEDPLFTQRETELLQKYLQEHGKMPGEDELEDLF